MFRHPNGKSHWKITNNHWSNTYSFDYDAFLSEPDYFDDTLNENCEQLKFMFNFDKWDSKKCLKEFEDPCMCYDCRKSIFENGASLRENDDLYIPDEEIKNLPFSRTCVNYMVYYLYYRRNTRVPLRELSLNACLTEANRTHIWRFDDDELNNQ